MLKCKKPFRGFGCGQCLPCRITKRRVWTHRIILESLMHASSSFATLTYDEANLPAGGTLVPRHVELWLKRFRKELPAGSVRFFLVGEYGDTSQRPHYHAALFGVPRELEALVRETWGMGHVLLGDLTPASARYIAGYVTKKMTSHDDPRLQGRHPEFSRMSRMPGIGATAIPTVSNMLSIPAGLASIDRSGDVPISLKHGTAEMPLGRYLRQKLRDDLGFIDNENSLLQPQWKESRNRARCEEEALQMSALWLGYCTSPKASQMTFYQYRKEMVDQQVLSIETKFNIHKPRKTI